MSETHYFTVDGPKGEKYQFELETNSIGAAIKLFLSFIALNLSPHITNDGIMTSDGLYTVRRESNWEKLTDPNRKTIEFNK